MSKLFSPPPGFIFASFLYRSDLHSIPFLCKIWKKKFVSCHLEEHPLCPMKKYYSKEMGDESFLKRIWIFSHELFPRESLVSFKLWATDLEDQLSKDHKRTINLDIGLLTLENMVLATGKPFDHRVYLDKGVYADLNYLFQKKSYHPLPWTYPDYALKEVRDIFNSQRKILHQKLREENLLWHDKYIK